jgi:hypothetical protein
MKTNLAFIGILLIVTSCIADPYGVETQEAMKNHVYVDASGHSPSLQAVLDKVPSGGVVELGAGTYTIPSDYTISTTCKIVGEGELTVLTITDTLNFGAAVDFDNVKFAAGASNKQMYFVGTEDVTIRNSFFNKDSVVAFQIDTLKIYNTQFNSLGKSNYAFGVLLPYDPDSTRTDYLMYLENCRFGEQDDPQRGKVEHKTGNVYLVNCTGWFESVGLHATGYTTSDTLFIRGGTYTSFGNAAHGGGSDSHTEASQATFITYVQDLETDPAVDPIDSVACGFHSDHSGRFYNCDFITYATGSNPYVFSTWTNGKVEIFAGCSFINGAIHIDDGDGELSQDNFYFWDLSYGNNTDLYIDDSSPSIIKRLWGTATIPDLSTSVTVNTSSWLADCKGTSQIIVTPYKENGFVGSGNIPSVDPDNDSFTIYRSGSTGAATYIVQVRL